jgi:enoyl-CoA hydratase/carnithine racemase
VDYADLTALRVDVEGGVATVVIDHPPINLIDRALHRELVRVTDALGHDESIRVVVLESALPDFFIAHFDVELILQFPRDGSPPTERSPFHRMCEHLRTMPKATIAMVEGRVGGGGSELILSCDMRFAARGRAVLSQPEVALGIIPGGTGTQRLPRLMGRSRAMEVVLGADEFDADTAERYGWVNRTFDPDELRPFVHRLAHRIASFPAEAVAEAKAAVLLAERGIDDDLLAEASAFNRMLALDDAPRRMQAFLERGGQTEAGELRLGRIVDEMS